MSRVLVTGASGPVGSALVNALLRDPAIELVLAVVDAPVRPPDGERLRHLHVDLARPRELRTLLHGPTRALGIDTVVHGPLHDSPTHGGRRAHALDVEATRELLRLAEGHPTLRRFVYRSSAVVYHVGADAVDIMDEEHALELGPGTPQWVRDRVEADLAVCAHAGLSSLRILVLRCAEIYAGGAESQLRDYLASKVCFRALGYDPMVELLSLEDATRALLAAVNASAQGVLNVCGLDLLPLSKLIAAHGRRDVPVPGPLLSPLYALRSLVLRSEFRYDMNAGRFHFGNILDGKRAKAALGYAPVHPIIWSAPASPQFFGAQA